MASLRTLVAHLGNAGAVANVTDVLEQAQQELDLIEALDGRLAPLVAESVATAA